MILGVDELFRSLPLIAILRGVRPDEVVEIGEALAGAGFLAVEVPLNSPDPLVSIERLSRSLGERMLVGAGTVLRVEEVGRVAKAGARLVVSPNFDAAVVRETKRLGGISCPGVATPSEGFAALASGADLLKLFPAEQLPPEVVKAWLAVFPGSARLVPVGGITAERMAPYLRAGAAGFGLGSALYRPGIGPAEVARRAAELAASFRAANAG